VQVIPTGSEIGQLFSCEKSADAEIELTVKGWAPVLVIVTGCAALWAPTFWLAKVSVRGRKLTGTIKYACVIPGLTETPSAAIHQLSLIPFPRLSTSV
jgi:hypothetical protein